MAAMAASSIWEGILARTGGGKAILPARAQGIPAAAVSPQRLLQRAPSRRSVLGARAPLVDERDDDQTSATRAQGASAKLPCMATATDGALYVPSVLTLALVTSKCRCMLILFSILVEAKSPVLI